MQNSFNILIADDDSSVYSASIKPFVRDLPEAKIFSAATPTLCRQMIASHKFQFILLDISIGPNDLSGLALLPLLRRTQADVSGIKSQDLIFAGCLLIVGGLVGVLSSVKAYRSAMHDGLGAGP